MSRLPLACASIFVFLGLACTRVPAEPPTTPAEQAPEPEQEPEQAPAVAADPGDGEPPEPEPAPEQEPEEVAPEPEPEEVAPEPPKEGPVVRANVRMESIEVDGMTIADLQCRIEGGGGLFGTLALFATLSESKDDFDACAPKGAAPVVHWRFEGKRTEVIGVDDPTAKVESCVAKVMKRVPPTMEAECHATLLIGDPDGAAAAQAD